MAAAAAVDPTDDGLNGFGGDRRRDDDEETAISGRPERKEGRIHEHDSTAIAPDAAPCSRTDRRRKNGQLAARGVV